MIASHHNTDRKAIKATKATSVLSKVLQYVRHGWPSLVPEALKPFKVQANELTVQGNCVLWGTHVIMSEQQKDVLHELHQNDVNHPEVSRMKSIA